MIVGPGEMMKGGKTITKLIRVTNLNRGLGGLTMVLGAVNCKIKQSIKSYVLYRLQINPYKIITNN